MHVAWAQLFIAKLLLVSVLWAAGWACMWIHCAAGYYCITILLAPSNLEKIDDQGWKVKSVIIFSHPGSLQSVRRPRLTEGWECRSLNEITSTMMRTAQNTTPSVQFSLHVVASRAICDTKSFCVALVQKLQRSGRGEDDLLIRSKCTKYTQSRTIQSKCEARPACCQKIE